MDEVDVKRVQRTLLKMAKKIAEILEENDIPYMIAYGTLLGAVRHKGFIPWDDDFDFYLFDDSYDIAIEKLRENLPCEMFLEDEKSESRYFHSWAHVKDLYSVTECREFPQDSLYKHKGISVDLYRTKCMELKDLEKFLNDENESYIMRRKKKQLISEKEFCNRMAKLEEQKKYVNNNVEKSKEKVFNLIPLYDCHYMKEKDVFPLKKYIFEGCEFLGPNSGETILTDIYNNFMELPPEEKRRCHYSSVVFLN